MRSVTRLRLSKTARARAAPTDRRPVGCLANCVEVAPNRPRTGSSRRNRRGCPRYDSAAGGRAASRDSDGACGLGRRPGRRTKTRTDCLKSRMERRQVHATVRSRHREADARRETRDSFRSGYRYRHFLGVSPARLRMVSAVGRESAQPIGSRNRASLGQLQAEMCAKAGVRATRRSS